MGSFAVRPRVKASVLTAAVVIALAAATVAVELDAPAARADVNTVSNDTLRTGWDQNEPNLSPSTVSGSDFGQLFDTQLDGQVYAQPVIAKNTVLAVTENNNAYGLDPVTGAIRWTRNVGAFWPVSAIGCNDLAPNIGITATPVVDPATGTAYFTAKVNDGTDVNHPHWYLHAIDITTGAERTGFPTTIAGSASNDPTKVFDPKTSMQRPGLLLLGGVVYAGFASHCDYGTFVGYVVGVNATTGKQTTMWATETGTSGSEAGIWQSGGGLVSDGAGRIIFTTGNGVAPPPAPGNAPPGQLSESVVRLAVNADGSLAAKDFFSPVNNTGLDLIDADLGSGGPMALPDSAGTTSHPHLLVQVGKDGRLFLLDRDNLGGTKQGAGGTDAVLQTVGPYPGVWGHPGFWGGDGGYVYTIGSGGYLRAFKVGVDGSGTPNLTATGASTSTWGFGSGSPVVTSSGSTSGTALVWAVYTSGSNGADGELRAYNAVPNSGVMTQGFAAPIGTAAKFTVPATDSGRVYVGTRDGKLFGFGRPAASALTGTATDFGNLALGSSATKSVTVTATKALTVSAVSTGAPFVLTSVVASTTLAAGQTLTVPVKYTPTATGPVSGALTFSTSVGTVAFDLHGNGTKEGLGGSPASLDFGQIPTTATATSSVDVVNTGVNPVTITGVTAPAAPFKTGALPVVGSTLKPGASVSVAITYAPTKDGTASSALVVNSSAGGVSIPLTGSSLTGAPNLSVSPMAIDFGTVFVGTTVTKAFTITNTGNVNLTLTKAAPPSAPFGTATPISEGQVITHGQVFTQTVTFAPTSPGTFSGQYFVNGNDGNGPKIVTVTGQGAASTAVPPPASGGWTDNGSAVQLGDTTYLDFGGSAKVGSAVYPNAVNTNGLHATFSTSVLGGTGDGLTLSLLDATKATKNSIGKSGASLGFAPLAGVAVVLDTLAHPGDPSGNFFGVTTGLGTNGSLKYVATAAAPTSLRSGTHKVDVTVTATTVAVSLDGASPLVATVAVPPQALLAFTASSGSGETHMISAVTITQPRTNPAGPITGPGNKCMTVANNATADGTAVQLSTCTGATGQTWSLPGDGTFRSLGKCLDYAGSVGTAGAVQIAPLPGTQVQLNTCTGSAAQQWAGAAGGASGAVVNAGSNKCLDDMFGLTIDGTRLQLWDCNASSSQKWKLPV